LALIRGQTSDVLAQATACEMLRRRPDMFCAVVPSRGHIPFLDEEEAVTCVRDWLAAVRSKAVTLSAEDPTSVSLHHD
jgi:hypothetical protein